MEDLFKRFLSANPAMASLRDQLHTDAPAGVWHVHGVAGSLRAMLVSALSEEIHRPMCVVLPGRDDAEQMMDDLAACGLGGKTHLFHGTDARVAPLSERTHALYDMQALRGMLTEPSTCVVTSPRGLQSALPAPDAVIATSLTLAVNSSCILQHVLELLDDMGFMRQDFVGHPGEYARRGGILDVFSCVGENPVRIEFVDDTIASLREFDAMSQRSIRELTSALIVPDLLAREHDPLQKSELPSSLFDYLPPSTLFVLVEPDQVWAAGPVHAEEQNRLSLAECRERATHFSSLLLHTPPSADGKLDLGARPQPSFNGSVRLLSEDLVQRLRDGYDVVLTAETQTEIARLKDLLTASRAAAEGEEEFPVDQVRFVLHPLHEGFILDDPRVVLYTEHQIFGRLKRRGRKRRARFRGFSEAEFQRLRKGDYVVHEDYGIGRFVGLKRIRVRNVEMEVATVQYEGKDTVYVNISYINKLQKYSSKDGHTPKLSKLGSGEWDRLKARTKKRVKDIARELMTLYAKRKHMAGVAFPEDTPWQRELEASFMYEDTFDQARTTLDVKRDMETPTPMDRLICGDVGFGKTEIAVRAAFKAVMGGKQVAVLVPTTILAMQHYNTFQDRMAKYGLSIQVISRFKSAKEQAEIVQMLHRGGVDIVIGTHRLLSKDIGFKDLGLLVIDEEHRFGVTAKEKLRQLRTQVDTLALTATPIPRTLHFSLMGARDLSVIATPPRNRLPIVTEIHPWDDDRIRDAVQHEMQRGGQIYVVHDRVQSIDDLAVRLQGLLPGVRIGVAHGQMGAPELERMMMAFLEKRIDMLVSTKIIESGLDIPNVNTIIINRADHFGMAELYQLRGRVGRSNIQAYAHLLTPPLSLLPRSTLQRLQALQEFNELGSGFNLAMRDLEIRGAGNLLGSEQSGFIEMMGFETYTRVLEEAVQEVKEQEFRELFSEELSQTAGKQEAIVDAEIDAFLPESYVASDVERMTVYRRLYSLSTEEQLHEVVLELKDRFGAPPVEVESLFALVQMKLVAGRIGFQKVYVSPERIEVLFPPESNTRFYESEGFQELMTRISRMRGRGVVLTQEEKLLRVMLAFPPEERIPVVLEKSLGFLKELHAPVQ
jgi:transcription-repair coupling factor (superfamily II helicase)